jgi:N-acyl-D-amino-acid deacylase
VTSKRPVFLLLQFIGFCLFDAHAQVRPVSGIPVPQLTILDAAMQDIMQDNDIGAGVLAVMKDDTVLYRRAFGWQDEEYTIPLRPDSVLRVASVTKPFTAAAIRHLVASGVISLDSQVFSGRNPDSGILDYDAFGTRDVRLTDITVDHLLRHRGGWDRDAPGIPDHTYQELQIADEMGIASPPSRVNIVRWIMGKPLQFDPGTDTAYANISFLLLGLIVEETSGESLFDYLHENVLAPIGVTPNQILYGRSFKSDQDAREPHYDAGGSTAANVFFPASSNDPFVERPYGSWNHEARIGQGAIVADPFAILAYLSAHQISGGNIGGPRPAPGNWKWSHTGSLRGTDCLARQRGDGINYTIIFNKRPLSGTSYALQMRATLDGIIESGSIASWPTEDIRLLQVSVPEIAINVDPVAIRLRSTTGRHYRLIKSANLHDWNPAAPPLIGDDTELSFVIPAETADLMYYRVEIRQ